MKRRLTKVHVLHRNGSVGESLNESTGAACNLTENQKVSGETPFHVTIIDTKKNCFFRGLIYILGVHSLYLILPELIMMTSLNLANWNVTIQERIETLFVSLFEMLFYYAVLLELLL